MSEIPPLPAGAIMLVEVGSTAHGTGLDGAEDHDEMGVVIEDQNQVFSINGSGFPNTMQRTQPEGTRSGPGDTDRSLYSLRNFVRLAAAGNPSILMAFWAPVIEVTPLGQELRQLGRAFIGRHIIPRYRGYMQGQGRRLLGLRGNGHGRRGGGGREELIAEHGYDTKYAMHCARLGFQCIELLDTNHLNLPIQGEPGEWLRAVRRGQVSFGDWWDRCVDLDHRMEARADYTRLYPGPDVERIETWLAVAHRLHWRWGNGS